jgi:hypothetical protein
MKTIDLKTDIPAINIDIEQETHSKKNYYGDNEDDIIGDDYTKDAKKRNEDSKYNLKPNTLFITTDAYERLQMYYNTNRMLTAKVNELLIQISELQLLLAQKVVLPSKKNKKVINDVRFK